MNQPPDHEPSVDNIVLLALFALLLFASPLVFWWSSAGGRWYLPYLFWLALIVLSALVFRGGRRHGS